MERINILWTGGFDSTFRVCQLSLLNVEIQPFYINFKNRKSVNYELKAIADITDFIDSNVKKKCRLLPLIIVHQDEIIPDEHVTNSMSRLKEELRIGAQYSWLTRFARQNDMMLEIGFEFEPSARIRNYFQKYGKIKKETIPVQDDGHIEYTELDRNECSEDLINIFGNFRFGLPLFNMTKLQAMEALKDIGYEQVIKYTWFCAHPLFGKPCGLCNPCEETMKANMGFRLPPGSRVLYKVFKTNPVGMSINNKLKAIYNRYWRDREGW